VLDDDAEEAAGVLLRLLVFDFLKDSSKHLVGDNGPLGNVRVVLADLSHRQDLASVPHLDGSAVELKDSHTLASQSASHIRFLQKEELALVIEAQRLANTTCLLPRKDDLAFHWVASDDVRQTHCSEVVLASFMSIFIAHVNFHPCDLLAETAQSPFDDTFDVLCEFLSVFNIAVRIDLDLHMLLHHSCLLNR
jgi:hypothetical protein